MGLYWTYCLQYVFVLGNILYLVYMQPLFCSLKGCKLVENTDISWFIYIFLSNGHLELVSIYMLWEAVLH